MINHLPFVCHMTMTKADALKCTIYIHSTDLLDDGTRSELECVVHNCFEARETQESPRSYPLTVSVLDVVPSSNVSFCFQGMPAAADSVFLGRSSCVGDVPETTFAGVLPANIFVICGNKAYYTFPENPYGICYLAFLAPLIRRVSNDHITMHYRASRALSKSQRIFGVLIPAYVVYNTQEEI